MPTRNSSAEAIACEVCNRNFDPDQNDIWFIHETWKFAVEAALDAIARGCDRERICGKCWDMRIFELASKIEELAFPKKK